QLQVVVVTRHLPQQLVLILIFFKFRHHLTQDAVLGLLDGHQATGRLNTVGGIGDLAGGFRRHQGCQGRVAQTVLDDVSTQGFPVQVQRLVANTVYIFLVGVGRQQSLGIGCFVKGVARTVFTRQLYRSLQQVVLDSFKGTVGQAQRCRVGVTGAVLGQVVSVVDDANAQGATLVGCVQCSLDRVVLIVQQSIQSANNQFSQTVQLVQGLQSTQIESRQRAQRDFTFGIVQIVQRLGGQGNFHAQVGLAHGSAVGLEWAVRVAVVHVLDV